MAPHWKPNGEVRNVDHIYVCKNTIKWDTTSLALPVALRVLLNEVGKALVTAAPMKASNSELACMVAEMPVS